MMPMSFLHSFSLLFSLAPLRISSFTPPMPTARLSPAPPLVFHAGFAIFAAFYFRFHFQDAS